MTKKMNQSSQKAAKAANRRRRAVKPLPVVSYVPSSKRIVMTYASSANLTEGAATVGATYFYRLNSVYDPDSSGVGTVAIGYNTWSALFLNYKVIRATVRVQATVTAASGALCNLVVAPVPSQAVVPANKQAWKTIRGAIVKPLTVNSVGGHNYVEAQLEVDNAWVAQVTKQQYATDMDFSGTIGSNPARQNYLLVAVDSNNSGTAATLTYNIQISYLVEWFNPTPMQ